MKIVTECEKTIMHKITWQDVYGEIQTDFVVINNSEPQYTKKEWKRKVEIRMIKFKIKEIENESKNLQ